jgi:hypothetical protein
MSFVQVGGDSASRPTYFELIAADQLVPSLKSAALYTLSVLSQRYPCLHRVLDHEDEALAALMLLIDWHSLAICDATFAEVRIHHRLCVRPSPPTTFHHLSIMVILQGLYGLRRGSWTPHQHSLAANRGEGEGTERPMSNPQGRMALGRLSPMQRLLSLVTQVLGLCLPSCDLAIPISLCMREAPGERIHGHMRGRGPYPRCEGMTCCPSQAGRSALPRGKSGTAVPPAQRRAGHSPAGPPKQQRQRRAGEDSQP